MTVTSTTTKIILQGDATEDGVFEDGVFIENAIINTALPISSTQDIVTRIAQQVNRERIVMVPSTEPSTDTVKITFADTGSIIFVAYNLTIQLKEAVANHELRQHNSQLRQQMSMTPA